MGRFVDLNGRRNVTNYIHMIGSGHMIDYIKRYVDFYLCSPPVITHLTILFLLLPMNRHGNSYNFSQQGWEALNQKIKQFYLKNTNHGGFTGKGETATIGEHMMPIMRMFQRFIMWKSGLGQAYFMAEDQVEFEEERSSFLETWKERSSFLKNWKRNNRQAT